MTRGDLDQIRRFNRLVARRIGALDDSYLSRGRPLGEARVIFEIGLAGTADLSILRDRLGLDSGYMSRLLRALEGQGVIRVEKSADDGRARQARLTEAGEVEFAAYDALSDDLAQSMLSPLRPSERERLVAAMADVERLLKAGAVVTCLEPADSDDAQWCLGQYGGELARRFDGGFDTSFGNAFDPADATPPNGCFVVARLDGAPVGCGALKQLAPDVGEIKRVWTAPEVRGMGVATRLMDRLEMLAREAGFSTLRLDTNKVLTEAHALYRSRGYEAIARYNDNPYAHHWFEKHLTTPPRAPDSTPSAGA